MLGLIVVAAENGPGLSPSALLENLLGAPLLARAIAGSLPVDEAVTGVLVVPHDLVDRVKAEVVDRFGLDEIDRVVAGGPDRAGALRAGLEALPKDVDFVLVQDAGRVLVPQGLVDRVVAAARSSEAAAPAVALKGHVVADEGGNLVPLDIRPRLRELQGPQAFRVQTLRAALGAAGEDPTDSGAPSSAQSDGQEADLVAQQGANVVLVAGDADNILLKDAADVSRALEVFARRAVDYAFLYPRDLLPEDPLKAALDPGEMIDRNGHDGTVVAGAAVTSKTTPSGTGGTDEASSA